jgi:hypothetical protein
VKHRATVSTEADREQIRSMLLRLGQSNRDPACLQVADVDALAGRATTKPARRLMDIVTDAAPYEYGQVTGVVQGLLQRPDLIYAESTSARTLRRLILTDDIREVAPHLDHLVPFALREPEVGAELLQRAIQCPELLLPGLGPLLERKPGAAVVLSLFDEVPPVGSADPWLEPCTRDLARLSLEQVDHLSDRLSQMIHSKGRPADVADAVGHLARESIGEAMGESAFAHRDTPNNARRMRYGAARGLALIAERVGQFDQRSDRIARDLFQHAIGQLESRAIERGLAAWLVSPVIQRKTRDEITDRVLRLDGDKRAMVTGRAVQVADVLVAGGEQPRRRELVEFLLRQAQGGHGETRRQTGHALGRLAGLEQDERERLAIALGNKPLTAVLGQRMTVVERFLDGLPADVAPLLAEHLQIGLLASLTADADSPVARQRAELTQRASRHLDRFSTP